MRNYELMLDIKDDKKIIGTIRINADNLVELLTKFQIELVIEMDKMYENKEKYVDDDIPF